MHSGGHRGFTVVTIVTLFFAPIFAHHHWMWRLVGKTEQAKIVQCVAKHPCPRNQRIVNIVKVAQAPTAPPKGKGSESGDPTGVVVDDPNSVAVSGDGNDQPDPAAATKH